MNNRVREIREKLGISQEELAERSGISRTTISDIECGKKIVIKTTTLIQIADALGFKVSDLFFRD